MSDDIETKLLEAIAEQARATREHAAATRELVEELRAQRTPKREHSEERQVPSRAEADERVARVLKKLGSAA